MWVQLNPSLQKGQKKTSSYFFMVFSRPLIRGGYTISATNQGSRKKLFLKITGSFWPFWGEGVNYRQVLFGS
jgi:hypothetical protein